MLRSLQKAVSLLRVLKGWTSIWLMAGRRRGEEERSSAIWIVVSSGFLIVDLWLGTCFVSSFLLP